MKNDRLWNDSLRLSRFTRSTACHKYVHRLLAASKNLLRGARPFVTRQMTLALCKSRAAIFSRMCERGASWRILRSHRGVIAIINQHAKKRQTYRFPGLARSLGTPLGRSEICGKYADNPRASSLRRTERPITIQERGTFLSNRA